MNYFVAPRSGERSYENFVSTLKQGVPFAKIRPYLSPEGQETLREEDVIYAWGNREGTKAQWEKMTTGDTVIFYARKKLVMYGEVYFKEHSSDLALAMWPPDENGKPWEYTFFLKNLKYISIPISIFNRAAGYKPNYIVQGFSSLNSKRVDQISYEYGSVRELLNEFRTESSIEAPSSDDLLYVNLPENVRPLFLINPNILAKSQSVSGTKKVPKPYKLDHLEQSKKNAITGSSGEEIVLKEEISRLIESGRDDLAKKVERLSLKDDSLGYDILSYEQDGTPKYIEVKTSTGRSNSIRFYMSPKEMKVSQELENYHLYFVSGMDTKQPVIIPLTEPLKKDQLSIRPDIFLVEGTVKL